MPKTSLASGGRPDKNWKPQFYVLAYQLALDGLSNLEIAKTLGVPNFPLARWIKKDDGFAFAISEGRLTFDKQKAGSHTLSDYIYGHLSPEAKKVWKELQRVWKEPNPILRMNRIFDKKGEYLRKELFVHALTHSHFDATQACRKLGVSKRMFDKWREEDLDFSQCVDEMVFHKKNFFESALLKQVAAGNSQVIQFVNRTQNSDRGYGEKSEIKHSGEIVHSQMLDITKLSFKLQQAILAEMRDQGENKRLTGPED